MNRVDAIAEVVARLGFREQHLGMRRDSAILKALLLKIADDARALAGYVEDLDFIAHERAAGERSEGRSKRQHYYLDNIGEEQAKRALDMLTNGVKTRDTSGRLNALLPAISIVATQMSTRRAAVFALFSGPGADTSMRGTTISKRDFDEQLANQQKRREDQNAYQATQIPVIDNKGREKPAQPDYPKSGTR